LRLTRLSRNHRQQVAGGADFLDDGLEVAAPVRLLVRGLVAEDLAREPFQVASGLFQRFRHALDQRFHQSQHDLFAADAGHRP
jgi:hypothetical protein